MLWNKQCLFVMISVYIKDLGSLMLIKHNDGNQFFFNFSFKSKPIYNIQLISLTAFSSYFFTIKGAYDKKIQTL